MGLVGPPTTAKHNWKILQEKSHILQLTISFNFFIGMAFTVFDAGFALKTQGSFVKGFTPLRAFVAGLTFSFKLSIPASLKDPDFFICSAANACTGDVAGGDEVLSAIGLLS